MNYSYGVSVYIISNNRLGYQLW